MLRTVILLLLSALLSGCAALPLPQKGGQGGVVETLQGSVNLSLASSAGQISGNGVLFFKRPDSFRLSMLAPFGQIVFDIIVEGEQVLCLMEGRRKGWQGSVSDIPGSLGTKVWPLLKWVMEPPVPPGPALERVFSRTDGTVEKVFYDAAGAVQRKVNSLGDEVDYSDYRSTEGVAFANRIEIKAAEGSRLVLMFDEPELNRPIENGIFTPDRGGFEILPLAEFKGF